MSKWSALTHKLNTSVMDYYGDRATYRIPGVANQEISVIYDIREVTVFDGSTSVNTEQIWFWLEYCTFFTQYRPKTEDEILFEGSCYKVAQVNAPSDGGIWVRCHQGEMKEGSLYRDF